MLKIIKNWLPVILWASIIFFFSSNPDPYRYLPESWRSAIPLPSISTSSAAELLGQLLHLLEYAVLAFLLSRALFFTRQSKISNDPNPSRIENIIFFKNLRAQQLNSLTAVFLTLVFAFSDEIHQLFVPGRAFQLIDLIIDFIGILFGVYLYKRLKIEPQRRKDTKKRIACPPGYAKVLKLKKFN